MGYNRNAVEKCLPGLYTWNVANDLVDEVGQNWDAATFSWKNTGNFNFTYHLNHCQLSMISQTWSGGSWLNTAGPSIFTIPITSVRSAHKTPGMAVELGGGG